MMFKFSGFSQKANAAVNYAIAEASSLGHCFVGSEHLLWGIVKEGSCFELHSLIKCGINSDAITEKLLSTIGRGIKTNLSPTDLTPVCKRILENAVNDRRIYGAATDINNIIASILKEQNCTAVKYLEAFGCDKEALFHAAEDRSACRRSVRGGAWRGAYLQFQRKILGQYRRGKCIHGRKSAKL